MYNEIYKLFRNTQNLLYGTYTKKSYEILFLVLNPIKEKKKKLIMIIA